MPRPPTKHGLERRFKSWRKGKSSKSKTSCLRNQLRGNVRLLKKFQLSENKDDAKRCEELKTKIVELERRINEKNNISRERQNASKSHGIRFLERQRLVRMERTLLRQEEEQDEEGLRKIALDEVYVAHFPHDIKYMPLFKKGNRVVDDWKILRRRAITRDRILRSIANETEKKVQWISTDQYNRLPMNWSVKEEEKVFGKKQEDESKKKSKEILQDDRFKLKLSHQKLLEAEEKIERELDLQEEKEENINDDEFFSDANSKSDEDKLMSLKRPRIETLDSSLSAKRKNRKMCLSPVTLHNNSESNDASSSGSDSSNSGEDSSGDDSSSSDSSNSGEDSSGDDSSSSEDDDNSSSTSPTSQEAISTSSQNDNDFGDDFFLPANTKIVNAFEKAKHESPALISTGDKSIGWATQKQRPGQWKKKRKRN